MKPEFSPNDAQRRAIEYPIDIALKVVAGAGTGKTAVLTQRFIHIVEKHQIPPQRILALTFTKKAAAEMRKRISDELLNRNLIERSQAPMLLWVGNYHSICLRLLRQYALAAGLDPSFDTLDETEQPLALEEVVKDFLDKKDAGADPDRFEALMIERIDGFVRNISTVVSRLKAHFIETGGMERKVAATIGEHYRIIESSLRETVANESIHGNTRKKAERRLETLADEKAHELLLLDAVARTFDGYRKRLQRLGALDFGDLVSYTCRLADSDPYVRRRFDYVLVDEFQDTDSAQYRLLERMSDGLRNVTVVCDKKQSIYEWREARLENIEDFPGETIVLEENYRSVGEILDSANHFIGRTMPLEKPLRPAIRGGRGRAGDPRVMLFRADGPEQEAEHVACGIAHLLESGECKPRDVAVLMRSVRASRPFEDALSARDIPFTTVGGAGFYDLCETKDLLALLRLIADPFDDLSMARILQSAVVGLSDATLRDLCRTTDGKRSSIYETLLASSEFFERLEPRIRHRLRSLLEAIDEFSGRRWSLTTGELVSGLLWRVDYLKYLVSLEGPRGARFSNVSLFYKTAARFEERNPGSGLEEFLSYMETAVAGGTADAVGEVSSDAVQIMTVHQAKGLEFPVVFVVNLKEGAFPLKFRGDDFGYDERLGLYARKLPEGGRLIRYEGGYGVGIEEMLRERRYLEENRILYVAMTRAKRLLYLTSTSAPDADDFFCSIEKFAAGAGSDSAEMAPSMPETKPSHVSAVGTRDIMGVEEIKSAAAAAVERVRRPTTPPVGTAEAVTLSYSRLALFRQCPMKYALRYVYNLPLAAHEDSLEERHSHSEALALGNLLHMALSEFHRREREGARADLLEIFERLAAGGSPNMVAGGKRMLDDYLAGTLSRMTTLYEEMEFHWKIGSGALRIMIEGKIDRIHADRGSLKIVDYKTGTHREEDHKLQLGIYRLAAEAALGEQNILTSNYYLSTGEEVEQEFSADELREIRGAIIEDARKIASADFGGRDGGRGEACGGGECGYAAFCRYGRKKLIEKRNPIL